MTEAEWLNCTDPQKMLEFLQGKATDRKLRLFVYHCFCRISLTNSSENFRRAVQVIERYADGLATEEERASADTEAEREYNALMAKDEENAPALVARLALGPKVLNPRAAAKDSAFMVAMDTMNARSETRTGWPLADPEFKELMEFEKRSYQAPILRDMFGNPFYPAFLKPAWLAWNDGTVHKIAQAIYDERAFDRMPILADALEEAGCTNAHILAHCRQPGEHVRGCWVVDAILGKE